MSKIFKKIYSAFDKTIIVPISRLTFNTKNTFDKNSNVLDKLLNRPTFTIYLSLILAVILFVLTDSKVLNISQNNAEVITNVPVKIIYNEEAYVVEGVPENVNITISGKKSDIYLAKQIGEYLVTLNLEKYAASDAPYKVALSYEKSIPNLKYQLDPSYVYALIKNKVSEVFSLSYELINEDKLSSKLSVKSVSLSQSEVVVKGSESTLAQVAKVKALIDLNNKDFTASGSYDLNNVKLAAYDNEGNLLENVSIVPNTISANIILDSYSKTVPIVVKTIGDVVPGKSIASIVINNAKDYTVTIYGNEELLSTINNIPVTVNVKDTGNNSVEKYNVTLSKPNGVRYMSETNLSISLTFGDEEQKTFTISSISKKNLGSGLNANIISGDDITVVCKGVKSVIDALTVKDISAYVDLTGLTAGDHNITLQIDNNNPLIKYAVSSTIKVRISKE